MDKVFIFAYHFGSGQDVVACAMDKERNGIANHLSSNLTWAQHDMGIGSDWKHEIYAEKFPNGYELVWLGLIEDDKQMVEIAGAAGVDVGGIL